MRDAGNIAFVFPILPPVMKITGGTTLKLSCTVICTIDNVPLALLKHLAFKKNPLT
jgi:hypothetical protein